MMKMIAGYMMYNALTLMNVSQQHRDVVMNVQKQHTSHAPTGHGLSKLIRHTHFCGLTVNIRFRSENL